MEYKIVDYTNYIKPELIEKDLNELAKDGWILKSTSIGQIGDNYRLFLFLER